MATLVSNHKWVTAEGDVLLDQFRVHGGDGVAAVLVVLDGLIPDQTCV